MKEQNMGTKSFLSIVLLFASVLVAEKVVTCSNVTPTKPEGTVIVRSGKTWINFHDSVEINGEFVVNSGAEVEITPVSE